MGIFFPFHLVVLALAIYYLVIYAQTFFTQITQNIQLIAPDYNKPKYKTDFFFATLKYKDDK